MAGHDKTRDTRSTAARRGSERASATDAGRSGEIERSSSARPHPGRLDPWSPWSGSSFGPFRSWTDQMERFFNSFGLGAAGNRTDAWNMFNPQIETFQRGDELVIRADLPGLSKDDVDVEVTDDLVVLRGERRHEHVEDREGFYRSERSYGSFSRTIPLPEGTITEKAQASFKDGVLEITMPVPPAETRRGRRIEIGEGAPARAGAGAASARQAESSDEPDE